ncbi:alpha-acetolactate decarboxylase [Corynebacterium phocae]|uniref:Alpha-acetolactate decarboxylase n=1 Tax=Corynebacterium phocae TaxID=161895 RepID=A0A1L7D5Z7_9CORY|nr:acetolactate decarboxylase [Corynebacterium phocae]APT93569.1 alpha-acetolactate decarboxylase [Corynebacterium phocae]KAA8728641.1 acetolactate decarboxylase [Corynebacterium phocae]
MQVTRHQIFQTSLISALTQGVYDDDMTLGELLGHGSFGLGTFNGLDGEMMILDGVCYRLRSDGAVTQPGLEEKTPYAVVTNFVPHITRQFTGPMTRDEFSAAVDEIQFSSNYMYALRVRGRFAWASARTVEQQRRPYRPMVEATENEDVVRLENFTGTVGGFRTPLYESGISVAGCHAHVINEDRTWGGHLVDFELVEATVELCLCTDLKLRLPLTPEFSQADLDRDFSEDIKKVEHQ